MDQVGAVLALIAGEVEARHVSELLAKIQSCIRERCLEPQLTADDVAAELRIPSRLLHRVLAGRDLTFASLLLDARTSVAVEMLGSGAAAQLTIATEPPTVSAKDAAVLVEMTKMCMRLERRLASQEIDAVLDGSRDKRSAKPTQETAWTSQPVPTKPIKGKATKKKVARNESAAK